MNKITTVLLVPKLGDPQHLLGDPTSAAWKLGARPPIMTECGICCGRWGCQEPGHTDPFNDHHPRRALVLAVDEQPVAEGMDRLDWCQHQGRRGVPGRTRADNRWEVEGLTPPEMDDDIWPCWLHGWSAQKEGLATLVVLNADGVEETT